MASTSSAPTAEPESDQPPGGWKAPGATLMSRMAINDDKAGMEGLDKEKINQIIYEASKGSKFYENERKKEDQLDQKIVKLKSYANQISDSALQEGKLHADLFLEKLKLERDLSHTIVHVDMDAFYAAVEMREDPSLRSMPMAVGGMGMLSTSNYLARKFGVRAAMPGFIGLKLCPNLVIVKPNFDKYTAVSREIRHVLSVYDPNFCPMSLDEAYLDFSQHLENRRSSLVSERTFILRNDASESNSVDEKSKGCTEPCLCDLNEVLLPSVLNSDVLLSLISDEGEFESFTNNFSGDSEEALEGIPTICPVCNKILPKYKLKVYDKSIEDAVLEMRNRIEQRTQLTASAGIAPNMMLAKICSDKNKPNGQYRIKPDILQIENFIEDLPIRKVSGIGKVTEKLLGGLDVIKCSDIYSKRSLLYNLFSQTSFHHFLSISLGIGSTEVERDGERKSISTEETFSEISDVAELCRRCQKMSEAVCSDMKEENIKGKTVTLKLKTISFDVMTRSQTLSDLTNDPAVVFNAAKKLLLIEVKNAQPAPLRLRLMGVRMSKLISANNEQVTVSSMFNKYKGKTTDSSKRDKEDYGHSVTYEANADFSMRGEEDEDEDFSRPLTTSCDPVPSQSKGYPKVNSLSPNTTKTGAKKPESASSGNILSFFTRQKEIQDPQQNHHALRGILTEKSPQQSPKNSMKQEEKTHVHLSKQSHGEKNAVLVLDDDEDVSSTQANSTCPICAMTLFRCDLLAVNNHIDACLNRQTIRDMLQDERPEAHSSQSSKTKRSRPEERCQDRKHEKVRKVQSSVLSYFQS